MKFTVLGAGGFIGRSLVTYLKSEGHEVLEIKRDYVDHINKPWGHTIYSIGLTSDFRSKPFETVEAHTEILSKVLRDAEYDSFLYLSSTRVYFESECTQESTNIKVNPTNKSDIYNISKLLGESLCLNINKPFIRIARLSNVVDASDNSDNFVSSLIKEALEGEIILRSDPKSAKDYISLNDALVILTKISLYGKSRIYNVASGKLYEHIQWVNKIKRATTCKVKILENAPKQIHDKIAIGKISKEFSFTPSCPIEAVFKNKINI
jgi:nucleoside-diphosphate-sugar epimerase